MLRLLLGRAGTGKTRRVLREIGERAGRGEKSVLLVPEQYSHEAERQLCAVNGNGISLWAEVLSFSGLSRRVNTLCPGDGARPLRDGGRLLVMELAFSAVSDRLETFSAIRRHSDFLTGLVRLRDELSESLMTPQDLLEAAAGTGDALESKVRDLALILEAYPGFIPADCCDPADSSRELADRLEQSGLLRDCAVYIDGFTDFTAQQMQVAEKLLKLGTDLTVCLNTLWPQEDELLFRAAHHTASRLLRLAREHFTSAQVLTSEKAAEERDPALRYLEANLFAAQPEPWSGGPEHAVRLLSAESMTQECEAAAAACLEMVRDHGFRWRDLAVAARGWESYGTLAESVFASYGIPVLLNQRRGILEKPVLLMVLSALETVENGFAYEDVFRYLKTGLAGVSREDCDELENYVLRWQIRGRRLWTAPEGWNADPVGMGLCQEQNAPRLARINKSRETAARPLEKLAAALETAQTAREKTESLWRFLEDAKVPARLESYAAALADRGELQLSDETLQLWEILMDALEQFAAILGDSLLSTEEFIRLLRLVLQCSDVGTIPAALDRVSMGEMDRMRRRDLKCLIVLGATDDRLPLHSGGDGLLSDEERSALNRAGLSLFEDADSRLYREMDLIYASLALPSDCLIMSYTRSEGTRPSFVLERIRELYGIEIQPAGPEIRTAAAEPCFELAAQSIGGAALPEAEAARSVLEQDGTWARRLSAATAASRLGRGSLSPRLADGLYGRNATLTASRVDSFYRCRYAYFMEYGLKARERKNADLDQPEFGTFVHYVLENVLRELERLKWPPEAAGLAGPLAEQFVARYTEDYLGGLNGRSPRFRYLFRRLRDTVTQIVLDTVDELSRSDFRPLDFELDFSRGGDLPPALLQDEDWQVAVRGKVDRVDGWVHDGKLYIRVVDYKTGVKKFSLSDVLEGMSMQMLIYLFVLERAGEGRYGLPVVPAGVLYTPARDPILSVDSTAAQEAIDAKRAKELVRSGLILDDDDVIRAMEHGDAPKYIPVTFKAGKPAAGSLASLEKMGSLSRHIDRMLLEMGRSLHAGDISADPFFKGTQDNACAYCAYREACFFDETKGDRQRWIRTKSMKETELWARMEAEHGEA